jgi:transketolase
MDLRPGDAAETEIAWRVAIERTDGPSFLALSRQNVPVLDRGRSLASAEGLRKGGYVVAEASDGSPKVILIASGTELSVVLEARERMEARGTPTRVVSLPSWFLFARQTKAYRDEVLPPGIDARVSLEAGSTFGWERWNGASGRALGLDHFGASAPAEKLYEEFGLCVGDVVEAASTQL